MFPSLGLKGETKVSNAHIAPTTATSCTGSWSHQDDEAQAEAIRTIQQLARSSQTQAACTHERTVGLEEQLRMQRQANQDLESKLMTERSQREAAQQQVLCLEYELDGKESVVQTAEKALERRTLDLEMASKQLKAAQESLEHKPTASILSGSVSQEARVQVMRQQLLDRESQLELKDQHISRLLSVLRQQRTILGDTECLF